MTILRLTKKTVDGAKWQEIIFKIYDLFGWLERNFGWELTIHWCYCRFINFKFYLNDMDHAKGRFKMALILAQGMHRAEAEKPGTNAKHGNDFEYIQGDDK